MLDDLRNSASKSFQDEEEAYSPKPREVIRIQPSAPRPFLGMTSSQRFVIALLIFLMVSVLGALVLVEGGKVFVF
ncbi:MAG: hypothetical protein Q7U74_01400 [Saprospiraceae bacterium]|nr:hypothetical protein [Saprospiraceae bacterium]